LIYYYNELTEAALVAKVGVVVYIKNIMRVNFVSLKNKIHDREFLSSAVLVFLLIVLTVMGVSLLRDYDLEGLVATISPQAEDTRPRAFIGSIPEEEAEESEDDVWIDNDQVVSQSATQDSYREVAALGEGLTHLARRALTAYLVDQKDELSAEQKIYAEDYIQLRIPIGGNRWLEVGQEIEISKDLIEEAVEQANQLTEAQLQNLQQYAILVF